MFNNNEKIKIEVGFADCLTKRRVQRRESTALFSLKARGEHVHYNNHPGENIALLLQDQVLHLKCYIIARPERTLTLNTFIPIPST